MIIIHILLAVTFMSSVLKKNTFLDIVNRAIILTQNSRFATNLGRNLVWVSFIFIFLCKSLSILQNLDHRF